MYKVSIKYSNAQKRKPVKNYCHLGRLVFRGGLTCFFAVICCCLTQLEPKFSSFNPSPHVSSPVCSIYILISLICLKQNVFKCSNATNNQTDTHTWMSTHKRVQHPVMQINHRPFKNMSVSVATIADH